MGYMVIGEFCHRPGYNVSSSECGSAVPVTADGKPTAPCSEDEDSASPKKTNIEKDGFEVIAESIWSVESTKEELRIVNPQVIVNYATFLAENNYIEDSFKMYERGVELFTFPVFQGGSKPGTCPRLIRASYGKYPPGSCKYLFLVYAQIEEDDGLAKRSMTIYERATHVASGEDKFEMFAIYIAKATANFGLPATRPIYEHALEGKLPKCVCSSLRWSREWNTFKIEIGLEDTPREMLRIKHSMQAEFDTEASHLTVQTISGRVGAKKMEESVEVADTMAAARSKRLPVPMVQRSSLRSNSDEIDISDDEL
ncbi:hypothetical protein HYPSUDRAFT_209452 [Hypholoma sublateritium FD-334 SS-4]|uniref:Pre-mRNA-splicing factor Syf1/CRNKL1-like C-terminal HAT-repeats domain-containing protein n=1 Tax=Hypholoma sublateritium (strain FD-334 SS-4) TaxID=945553 RepID=A0A0D2LRU0_HYPSF|nr:hypothetical protein HYPSUDRAFT_209452 [Hypholoma sublateritium FD-334 SS-4]